MRTGIVEVVPPSRDIGQQEGCRDRKAGAEHPDAASSIYEDCRRWAPGILKISAANTVSGSTFAYGLVSAGVLNAKKAGKRTLIARQSAEAWFNLLPPMEPGANSYGGPNRGRKPGIPQLCLADMKIWTPLEERPSEPASSLMPRPPSLDPKKSELPDLAGRPLVGRVAHNVARGGKSTKLPYDPKTGRQARANDPVNLGYRCRCISCPTRLGPRTRRITMALGFSFAEISPALRLGGIDLDASLIGIPGNPDLADWADPIVAAARSYTEVSPSGTGVKTFFLYRAADLPALRSAMGTQWSRLWARPGRWRQGASD